MKFRHIFISIMLMLSLSPQVFAAGKTQSFKCWTNKQGIRECGNEVPPEYAQGQTKTMNSRGMTTKVEDRAQTQAEAERRAQEQKEAELQQKKALEASKEQKAYDRVLLSSYLSEEEIVSARTRKLAAIDAAINYNNGVIVKLEEKLKREQQKAESQKNSGKETSADELKDMELLQKQIDDKKTFIATKQKEKEETNVEYEGYLNRFRELKAGKEAK